MVMEMAIESSRGPKRREQQWRFWFERWFLDLMHEFEETTAHRHGHTHDNALTHTADVISGATNRRLEQMIRRLLERRQHQHTRLHLGYSKSSDAHDFPNVNEVMVMATVEWPRWRLGWGWGWE